MNDIIVMRIGPGRWGCRPSATHAIFDGQVKELFKLHIETDAKRVRRRSKRQERKGWVTHALRLQGLEHKGDQAPGSAAAADVAC
jgi:hypothetical protein